MHGVKKFQTLAEFGDFLKPSRAVLQEVEMKIWHRSRCANRIKKL